MSKVFYTVEIRDGNVRYIRESNVLYPSSRINKGTPLTSKISKAALWDTPSEALNDMIHMTKGAVHGSLFDLATYRLVRVRVCTVKVFKEILAEEDK